METTTFIESIAFLPVRAKRFAEIGFQTYKKDLLSVNEACEFLTLSRSSLYRGINAGKIPVRPVTGVIRFDLIELSLIKSGEDALLYIQPENLAPKAAPQKKRGRIPALKNHADELLELLNK